MRLSRKTDYGVMLVGLLRQSYRTGKFVALAKIAEEHGLPRAFLEKLAETLRRKKILESKRGSYGGYRLMRDPKKITLREIIEVFEEPPIMRCMKSSDPEKRCPYVAACPTRSTWHGVQNEIYKIFENVTIANL